MWLSVKLRMVGNDIVNMNIDAKSQFTCIKRSRMDFKYTFTYFVVVILIIIHVLIESIFKTHQSVWQYI